MCQYQDEISRHLLYLHPPISFQVLISIPALLAPFDFSKAVKSPNLGVLVQALGRKLVGSEETRLPAYMALQKIADVLGGPKHFHSYLSRFNSEQRAIYDELSCAQRTRMAPQDPINNIVVGRKLSGRGSPYNPRVSAAV